MKTINVFLRGLRSFAQGKGFALLAVVCVGVITATALWTRQQPLALAAQATPPVIERAVSLQMQNGRSSGAGVSSGTKLLFGT